MISARALLDPLGLNFSPVSNSEPCSANDCTWLGEVCGLQLAGIGVGEARFEL